MSRTYTSQAQLRAAFWEAHPDLPRRRIRSYSGKGLMFPTDTRTAWVDWIDGLQRNREISDELANRATISRDDT